MFSAFVNDKFKKKTNHFAVVSFSLMSVFFASCGQFNPINNKIDSTSDGSYVVETSLSDAELLDYGVTPVYRFQSVPNLIAVKQINGQSGSVRNNLLSAPRVASLIAQNTRSRPSFLASNHSFESNNNNSTSCLSAYCEAHFDAALRYIQSKSIALKNVHVGIIDSGVLPSTMAIKHNLSSSTNITNSENPVNWLAHATMISSLLVGVTVNDPMVPQDIYASNAKLDSVKITFSGETDTSTAQQYGSMQLAVAMDKALAAGDKVINLSLTYQTKPDENIAFAEQAIMAAGSASGAFFVAAAGNENVNSDDTPAYPAGYNMNNLIVVGSHTATLAKAQSSNYGNSVDLTAQGASIPVNDKSGNVGMAGGTSFAAPLVASALSLYLGASQDTHIDVSTVIADLMASSNPVYQSSQTISHYGRLDVEKFIKRGISHSF